MADERNNREDDGNLSVKHLKDQSNKRTKSAHGKHKDEDEEEEVEQQGQKDNENSRHNPPSKYNI